MLSITHDIDEAASADQVVILNDGEINDVDTPEVIFSNAYRLKELRFGGTLC